jgi:hypothetical protein
VLALLTGLVGALAEVDVDELDRDDAREAARDELSRPEYDAARPPLWQRLLGRAVRELVKLLARAAGGVPGGRVGVVLLVLLLVGIAALVVVRLRPSLRQARGEALFGGELELSAAQHRERADAAAAEGRYDEAVRERLRAVVRELEARGVLDRRPGRTAGEVARDGGAAVPAVADDLRRATTTFDEVWYGGRTADAGAYRTMVEVDLAVTGARLVSR